MRAGYRKFFMFAQVATLIGIGYLMTRFWEDAKNQCELYNLPQKLWVIFGIMFICGIVSWGSVDALTRNVYERICTERGKRRKYALRKRPCRDFRGW